MGKLDLRSPKMPITQGVVQAKSELGNQVQGPQWDCPIGPGSQNKLIGDIKTSEKATPFIPKFSKVFLK